MKLKYICIGLALVASVNLLAQKRATILHTNDTHSRIESLPSTDKYYPNTAGVVNRKATIDSIRNVDKDVLLFDAGDFVQGTPYFNLFKGKAETDMMNEIGYDAVTIGNHEFDYGLDNMKLMFENLKAPVVNSNYDFSNTVLKDIVKPYIILNKFGLRIGILGVGAAPEGLIQEDKYQGMIFKPIIESANKTAEILKKADKCDLIICLSHIGYRDTHASEGATAVLDHELAQQSRYIDIIIGGHSHTYLEKPVFVKNKAGKEVMITQMGKNGTFLGKIDVELKAK